MDQAVIDVLEAEPKISFALLFGSAARGTSHPASDLDVAIGVGEGTRLTAWELGDLLSRLESVTSRKVDLVVLEEAPVTLAYRVFRDGQLLFERDHRLLARRKAEAILAYLDFRPLEELCERGVLDAASRGR